MRTQIPITLGTHCAQLISQIETSDGKFRLRFLVLDNELKQTETIATNSKFTKEQITDFFDRKSIDALRNSQWSVEISLNPQCPDLRTITAFMRFPFNVPKWFIEAQCQWQGCSNSEAPSEIKKAYLAERELKDERFRNSNILRRILAAGIAGKLAASKYITYFGCEYPFLIAYLEDQFKDGQSWSNTSSFSIDHLRPLVSFDLTDMKHIHLGNHWTNLGITTLKENIQKYCNVPL